MKKLALILLMAGAAIAGELTGKWSGTFNQVRPDGTAGDEGGALMVLTLAGTVVTGTAGPDESRQMAISNGKLEGKKLTFEVVQGGGPTLKFDLTFDGETIKGSANGERGGQAMSAKVDLKRKQ